MSQVNITLRGAGKVIALMDGLPREMVSHDFLSGIGTLAVRSVTRDIRAQRSPDGTAYRAVTRFGQAGQRMIDTARLINSIHFEVSGESVFVGTNVDYAAAQNFGGTWGPKTAKLLAIPLTRAIARAYIAGKSLRDQYPEAFIFKSGNQGLFLVRKDPKATKGSKRQLEFLFKLVPSVTIQGTHFLDRLSDQGEDDIRTYIANRLAKFAGASA